MLKGGVPGEVEGLGQPRRQHLGACQPLEHRSNQRLEEKKSSTETKESVTTACSLSSMPRARQPRKKLPNVQVRNASLLLP